MKGNSMLAQAIQLKNIVHSFLFRWRPYFVSRIIVIFLSRRKESI